MPLFQIRPCTASDFDEVFELLRQLWPDRSLDRAATGASYERALLRDWQTFLCATEGGRLIAFGSLSKRDNLCQGEYMAYVNELVVDGAHRRRGIGTALMAALVEVARRGGCRRIALDSAFHRTEAHLFYKSIGFENHGYLFSMML
jgi:GNAT superfamily N-acetyltransferase